jgi:hypothetical protein
MKHILSKADIILFIIIVAIAIAGIFLLSDSGSAQTAMIRVDGQIVREVNLDVDQSFWVGDVRFEVKGGDIAFVESDCPGKECIHAGWLSTPGSSMACLPNKVSVTLNGESEVDVIAE